ncbi:hypothetical protein BH11PSE9_BH11PSE9_07790 [soil metagenome]
MIKKILAAMLALFAAAAFAAVDVNKATQAELEGIKGIGPSISAKILDERKKGAFKDWQDMVDRVKGVGEGNAAKFSTEGLTVNGAAFTGAPAKADAPKKADKAAKADAKPADAKPATAKATATAAPTAPAASTAMTADEKKAAKAKAKEDKKAERAAAKAAKASAAGASGAASAPAKK